MKGMREAALGLLAGLAIATIPGRVSDAQPANSPHPAFLVAEVQVTDQAGYQAYLKKALASLEPYHARTLARGKPDVKEGEPARGNIVMIEFPSMADALKWYSTPPYSDLIAARQKTATTRLYFVDGVAK